MSNEQNFSENSHKILFLKRFSVTFIEFYNRNNKENNTLVKVHVKLKETCFGSLEYDAYIPHRLTKKKGNIRKF